PVEDDHDVRPGVAGSGRVEPGPVADHVLEQLLQVLPGTRDQPYVPEPVGARGVQVVREPLDPFPARPPLGTGADRDDHVVGSVASVWGPPASRTTPKSGSAGRRSHTRWLPAVDQSWRGSGCR